MQDTFGKQPAGAGGTSRIGEILIPQTAYESGDPCDLVQHAVEFVNLLSEEGAYLRHEIPINALRSYHADYYLAQVSNGGHGQFVGNCGWDAAIFEDISNALHAMGAHPYDAIFNDLRRLIESDPKRAEAIANGASFGKTDPAIAELDKRYFAQNARKVITPANARWLRSLPELKVLPEAEYSQAVQALCAANPHRTLRLQERQLVAVTASLSDPVRVASQLLCAKAQCLPAFICAGDPAARAPDGRQGTGWYIQSSTGRQIMFVFDDAAMLCEPSLDDGRKPMKEIARISASEVADAIEAARRMPMVAFATLLCGKLSHGETLEDLYATGRHTSGELLWVIETNRRTGLVLPYEGTVSLYDLDMNVLAEVSNQELHRALV